MFFQDYFGYLMSSALNNFIHTLESACFISTRGKEGGREGEREARRESACWEFDWHINKVGPSN